MENSNVESSVFDESQAVKKDSSAKVLDDDFEICDFSGRLSSARNDFLMV